MDGNKSNPAGGVIAVNPAITPLRWKLDAETEMPAKGQMVKNAAGAFARNLKSVMEGNSVNADPDVIKKRKAICKECEHMHDNRCSKCGCWLQYKAILRAEKCPIGKWE
tara:strand:- start:351 stop:677 length:327 start_codon:yes stop_codon:yes gene_type:complete